MVLAVRGIKLLLPGLFRFLHAQVRLALSG